MSEKEKPLFMQVEKLEDPPALPEIEEMLPDYDKPLKPRHKVFALMVSKGCTNKEIKEKLGYVDSRISVLKGNPAIKREIARIQERLFEKSLDDRMKELGPAAMDVVEEAITHDTLEMKDRVQQARWLIEKLTGKPAQQVDHKGEINIGVFMDKIDKLLDVTPTKKTEVVAEMVEEETDKHEQWLEKNI